MIAISYLSLTVRFRAAAATLTILCSFEAAAVAMDGRVVLPDGRAAGNLQITVAGHPGSVRTDAAGRFRISPDPAPDDFLIIIGPRGEVYEPLAVSTIREGVIALQPTMQESVTVTGAAPNIESSPGAALGTIPREELEQRRPQNLTDALATIPGVSRIDESQTGVPVIRGLARGRTLILHDGARVTAERRAGPSGTFLDPFSLAAVEVTRGPGSVAYGSDAFGGVIHARPRDPVPGDPELRAEASASSGGRENFSGGLEGSFDIGRGALLAMIHGRDGNDGHDGNDDEIENSSFSDRGAALRYLLPLASGNLRLGLQRAEARDTGKPAQDSNVTRTMYPVEDSTRATLSVDVAPDGAWSNVALTLFAGSYQLVTDRERQPTDFVTRRLQRATVDANDASLRLQADRELAGGRFSIGTDINSRFNLHAVNETQSYSAADEPTSRARDVGVDEAGKVDSALYVIYERPAASRLTLGGGARVDRVSNENRGGFFGEREEEHTALSGHLSGTVSLTRELTGVLQLASGFRDPTLSDRYFRGISGRGFVIGNPDLGPERSLQFDTGLRWQRSTRALGVYAYVYRIDDLIERFRNGDNFNFRNRGTGEIRGLEVEGNVNLTPALALQGSAAWSTGEVLDDRAPLADIAPLNGQLTLRWSGKRLSGYGRLQAAVRDDRPGPTEIAMPGYGTIELGAGLRVSAPIELRAVISNLTDRQYAETADEVAAYASGRALLLSVISRF